MKNNPHQILFKISYKTCAFKGINFSVTVVLFLVKNYVISPSKILAPLLSYKPEDDLYKILRFGHNLNNIPFSGWLTALLVNIKLGFTV